MTVVRRTDEDHRVVAADVLGVDLQVVVGRAADAGLAAEHVHDLAAAVAVDQQPRRAVGRRLRRHAGVGLGRLVRGLAQCRVDAVS